MKNRWFSNWRNRPLAISALGAALYVVLFFAVPDALAGTPDWLRAAAAMPLPAYPPETKAVMLLDEQITTVREDGEIRTTYRRAWKILRPDGRDYGSFGVGFDGETRLTFLKAWAISPKGGDYEMKEKDALETSMGSGSFYDDVRMKFMKISGADVGSVVGYEYEQRRRPFVFQDKWLFQDPLPVRKARFVLTLPAGWEYRATWMNYADQKPQPFGQNGWAWELENVAPIEEEPLMPPWKAVAGWLAVTYMPRDQGQRAKSHASWSELGVWYAQLVAGRRDSSPEIKQKVAALTAGAGTTLDKIRALAAFAQRDVRYVAIEIGIGGYQPHAARDIFSNRFGDCKDKATVLSTMLKEIGIASNYVLINTTRGVTAPSFPSMLNFNHVILAIHVPPDVPTANLYATREHPDLGKLLFFDPTDDMTPLGYLPPSLQMNYGLLVTDSGGDLLELPLLAPPTNRLLRVGKLTLSPTGAIIASVKEIRWGTHAINRRETLLRAQGAERQKVMENFLCQFLGGFRLRKAEVENLGKYDESLVLNYEFDSENYAKTAGNLLLLRPRVLGQKSDDVMERKARKLPVEFSNASFESDIYEFVLPAGFRADELPPPVEVDVGFAEYRSRIEVEGNILRYKREYKVKDVRVPTARLEDLKKLNRVIAADERNAAVLARGTP
ncbi:MAG: DUF3857 and transglutaminase domain-containing protein [Acidobacteria bacterium]|nr:DUF3857 and transglutaminase domain-containing protein [Acidobacteriota bacterium]